MGMADFFIEAGYHVTVTNSAAGVLSTVRDGKVHVVLLGNEFDQVKAIDLIPLLKKVNRDLTIILVSDELNSGLARKVREEGIFYHALKPTSGADREELLQVIQCAFENIVNNSNSGRWH